MNTKIFTLALAASIVSTVSAQNVIAVSGPGKAEATLATHNPMIAFVTGDLNDAQGALKNAAISAAEGKVIGAIAVHALPIPIVGSLPVEGAMRLLGKVKGKLEKPTVKGVNVAYLSGLAAETTIQPGQSIFTVPGSALQGGSPILLRLKLSAKDSARIVRGIRVSMKMTGSKINPATLEVLGEEQNVISCRQETVGTGDVVLTTSAPLEAGEYAIVLVPGQTPSDGMPAGVVWDFRVQ